MPVARNIALLALCLLVLAAPAGAQYQLGRTVLGNGVASGGNLDNQLHGTVGQVVIGDMAGDELVHQAGFWIGEPSGTGVDDSGAAPAVFALGQNHPNPFNPLTTIRYSVPRASRVVLGLYDIRGRELALLVDAEHEAGSYDLDFNASSLASGVYFYRMLAGDFSETKKLVLLK